MRYFRLILTLGLLMSASLNMLSVISITVDDIEYDAYDETMTAKVYKDRSKTRKTEYRLPAEIESNGKIYAVTNLNGYIEWKIDRLILPNNIKSVGYECFKGLKELIIEDGEEELELGRNDSESIPNWINTYTYPFYGATLDYLYAGRKIRTFIGKYSTGGGSVGKSPVYPFISTLEIGPNCTSVRDANYNRLIVHSNTRTIERLEFSSSCTYLYIDRPIERLFFFQVSRNGMDLEYSNAHQLKTLETGDNITRLNGDFLKSFTNLEELKVSKSVSYIDFDTLAAIGTVNKIELSPENKAYIENNHCIFKAGDLSDILYVMANKDGETLDMDALPSTVTSIRNHIFKNRKLSKLVALGVTAVGKQSFYNCTTDGDFVLGCLDSIGEQALAGSGINDIKFGDKITTIDGGLFRDCKKLKSVMGCANVNAIGGKAFSGCTKLRDLPDGLLRNAVEIGDSAFANTYIHGSLALDNIAHLGNGAFTGVPITSIDINGPIQEIGNQTFEKCTSLETVKLSETVTGIGTKAFKDCTSLKIIDLDIPALKSVGEGTFMNCTSLDLVNLSSQIADIPADMFNGCVRLTEVEGTRQIESIGDRAFNGCETLKTISLSENIETIGSRAFYGCEAMTSISLGSAIGEIGQNAFFKCTGLNTIKVNRSIAVTAPENIFDESTYFNATLYIPCGEEVRRSYFITSPWDNFFNVIQTEELSGADSVAADGGSEEPAVYYDLNGRRVDSPARGVYIRRQGTRTAKVVM